MRTRNDIAVTNQDISLLCLEDSAQSKNFGVLRFDLKSNLSHPNHLFHFISHINHHFHLQKKEYL